MTNSSLYKSLLKHKRKGRSSFHIPGHKNSKEILPYGIFDLDFTELPDTDSLYEANGAILETEKQAAELFGAKRTLISAGGCTLCIQTMLKLCTGNKKKIIMGRTIHKSAVNALALLGLDTIWVYPRKDEGLSYPGRIYAEDIEKALIENKDAAGVYITSPDYYGIISDIGAIAKVCKQYKVPLLVDSAHGSHLPFVDESLDPIKNGVSMVAFSAHKTLPVLTGGAYLHICEDEYIEEAKSAMSLFGSTSPSFPVMASLDLSNCWCKQYAKREFKKLKIEIDGIKEIAKKKGIAMPSGMVDPVRLCLNVKSIGLSGQEAGRFFRSHKVEPEYCDEYSVVFIATPFNTKKDLGRLKRAIVNLPVKNKNNEFSVYNFPKTSAVMSPRKAVFSNKEQIGIDNSKGRIAAETLCPCPPGIPVFMPGELITDEAILFLKKYGISTLYVVK